MKTLTAIGALLFSTALMFAQTGVREDSAITAVTGESWLHHIHRSFDETSMGKTWQLGPSDPAIDKAAAGSHETGLSDSTAAGSGTLGRILHGSDLYRLNCRGCHGESGRGAPPEIASLINPVRATSVALVAQRMESIGMTMSRQQTAEMANQSKQALLKRLQQGGTDMPSFHHLRKAEIRSLLAYLRQLAGIPGGEREQIAIQESHVRVGELIVKSTCHVCHDATGPNPTPERLSEGAIPPLSVLPERVNRAQLVRKITTGAPVVMGTAASLCRGRMPVFSYLTHSEAADVYGYLTSYPPAALASFAQTSGPYRPDATDPPTAPPAVRISATQSVLSPVQVAREEVRFALLPIGAGLFTAALLVLGCCTTLREFHNLSLKSLNRRASHDPGIDSKPRMALHHTDGLRLDSSKLRAEPSNWIDQRKLS